MEYRRLGGSGAVVSALALGAMTFGAETGEDGARAQLDRFVEVGGTLIDTADVYSKGASEEIVGRWLSARPADVRDRVVVATKGRFALSAEPNGVGLSRRHLTRAIDASLRRLGVDCIDLYQVHAYDPLTPLEETLRCLDDQARAGKIHYVGLSNFTGWQLQRAVDVAEFCHLSPPVTLQPQYSLLVREVEWELVPACLAAGIGLLPWSPLAGGWLTGKYGPDERPTGATRAGENPRGLFSYDARGLDQRTWQVVDAVREVAADRGRVDGPGGTGLAAGPASRLRRHPRRPHPRAARGQSRRRGDLSRAGRDGTAGRGQRRPGRRLPVRTTGRSPTPSKSRTLGPVTSR